MMTKFSFWANYPFKQGNTRSLPLNSHPSDYAQVLFDPKGNCSHCVDVNFVCTALSCCSDERFITDQSHSIKAPLQLLYKMTFISDLLRFSLFRHKLRSLRIHRLCF